MHSAAIVVPCYNEARRLDVDAFVETFENNPNVDFCFVDDGSEDGTLDVINEMGMGREDRVLALQLPSNQGKAEAVRRGILHVLGKHDYEVVGYWDADTSTPLTELQRLLELFSANDQYVMLSGCRVRRLGAQIQRHWYRHYLGRLFATVVSLMLRLPTYDTQCGAKLFRSPYGARVFEKPFVSSWFFDVELFFRVVQIFGRSVAAHRILEAPLNACSEIKGSKLKLADYLLVPFDLNRIRKAYKLDR
jgi:glycosyltransferase involved in cell wall biosynthesis